MSLLLPQNNKFREIKLHLGRALHSMNIVHAEMFPGSNPGFYSNALGNFRLKRWYDRRQKVNFVQYAMTIAMFSLLGTYVVSIDPSSVFGWIFLSIAIGMAAFEIWDQAYSKHESNKTIEKLYRENEKRKIENQELKRELDLLKKKFNDLKK